MAKNKNNGLKGLLLLLVIVAAVLAIILIEVTQSNMRVLVTAYKQADNKPLMDASISINGETSPTDIEGRAFFKLRVSENDVLVINGELDGYKSVKDTIKIDGVRAKSKNVSTYLIFNK